MSRWNIKEHIVAEIEKSISVALALTRNIEGIDIAVLQGITQFDLVPAP